MNKSTIYKTVIASPVGPILLGASGKGIVGLYFDGVHRRQPKHTEMWKHDDHRFGDVRKQLAQYFSGKRRAFDLELDVSGTPFFQSVWAELRKIPYGKTISYTEIAEQIGNPKAVRAVGMANARNPVSIIVPCHRVVARDGKLTGYAGGVNTKQWLLDLENSADAR